VRAYFLETNEELSLDRLLKDTGVQYFQLNVPNHEEQLAKMRTERGYTYHDLVTISPTTLANYEEKIKNFFTEHLHKDEEIRLCLEGGGFFDVRTASSDAWVRIHCMPGDLVILPAGIYHRFKNDEGDYSRFMRLFQGEPIWTPYNRSSDVDKFDERSRYLQSLSSKA